jgi:hypothetical protein
MKRRAWLRRRRYEPAAGTTIESELLLRGASWKTRLLLLIVGLALLAGGWLLVRPNFAPTPNPAEPWHLWVSTDTEATSERPTHEPSWLLNLHIEAPTNCEGPAIVTGRLQWEPTELLDRIKQPTRLLVATAGVRILHAEVNSVASIYPVNPKESTWHTVPLVRDEGAAIALSPVARWTVSDVAAQFRLTLMAAHTAGYGSCYLTSPAVGPLEEAGEEEVVTGVGNVPFWLERHHLNKNLATPLKLDAVVEMSVPYQEPDRAALEAGAHVQRKKTVLVCTTHEREPPSELEDQFYYRMTHVNERFCSSVQTFRANNASAKLIERGVLSTIFIAVAATLLVQALAGNNIRLIVVRVASRGRTHRRRR